MEPVSGAAGAAIGGITQYKASIGLPIVLSRRRWLHGWTESLNNAATWVHVQPFTARVQPSRSLSHKQTWPRLTHRLLGLTAPPTARPTSSDKPDDPTSTASSSERHDFRSGSTTLCNHTPRDAFIVCSKIQQRDACASKMHASAYSTAHYCTPPVSGPQHSICDRAARLLSHPGPLQRASVPAMTGCIL